MQAYEKYEELKLGELRRDIQLGLDAIERGELIDGEQAFEKIEKELEE